ncbi:MAG: hypothetical protein J6W64_00120, partial [Bacilli bacterium]|nr:hypothetical protein [Bacilli bacterium]
NKLNKDTLEQLVDWYSELYNALLKKGIYKKPNGKPYKSYFFMPTDIKQEFVSDLVSSLKAVTKRYQVIVDEDDIKALCRLLLTKEKYLDNVKDVKIKINDISTKDIVDDDVFENFDK